jgi:hypothetical protein
MYHDNVPVVLNDESWIPASGDIVTVTIMPISGIDISSASPSTPIQATSTTQSFLEKSALTSMASRIFLIKKSDSPLPYSMVRPIPIQSLN